MKPNFKLPSFLLGSALLAVTSSAQANTYFWDNNGATSGFGTAAGTWAAPTTNNGSQGWSTDSSGQTLPTGTTTTGTGDTVNFGTGSDGLASGSITVSGTVNVGNINFGSASGGITLSGGTISIAGGGTIANNTSSTAAVGSTLAGSGGFVVNNGGTGSLQFTTNISNTGSMRIDNGSVLMSNAGLIGSLSKVILNGSNAKFRINISTGTNTSSKAFEITENGGTISKGGTNTLGLSGTFTATGSGDRTLTLENNGSGDGTLSGSFILSDPGSGRLSLNKTGGNTWVLSVANTFSGSTKISDGILSLTNANALQNSYLDTANSITGTTTDGLRLGTGSALNIGGLMGNKNLASIFNTTSGTYGSVGSINLKVASGNDFSYSGIIANGSGNTTLTKTGAGDQTLSGDNTYTGLTSVSAGTLTISGNRDLGVIAGGFRISGDAVLNLSGDHRTGSDITVGYTTSGAGTLSQSAGMLRITSGNAVLLGNSGTGATGTYNLSGGTLEVTYTSTTRGVMIGANTGSGTFNLSGNGYLDLTNSALLVGRSDGSNSSGADAVFSQTGGNATIGNLLIGGANGATNPNITADLNLSAGTFTATNFLALAGGDNSISTINISGTADVTLPAFPTARGSAATATVTFNGGTLRNAGASATYMQGLTNAYVKAGGAQFNTSNGDITIAQNLLTDPVSTGGGLTKEGTNALTLDGTSTYTGATTVTTGTLIVNGNISTSVLTTVRTGATLGGSGTVGDLTINSGGFFSPGNSPGIMTVDGDYIQNGQLNMEIEGLTAGNGSGFHDQVAVNGAVTIGGSLNLASFSGFTPVNGDLIFILLNDGTDAITNTFNGLVQGAVVGNYLGFDWQISYTGNSTNNTFTGGNDVVLMAVPEPRAALLGGLGLLMLLRRRRI